MLASKKKKVCILTYPLPGPGSERGLAVPHHPDAPPVVAAGLLHLHVDLVAGGEPRERDGRGGHRVAGDDDGGSAVVVVVLQRGDGEEGAAPAHEAQLRAVRLPPRRRSRRRVHRHLVVVVVGRHDGR